MLPGSDSITIWIHGYLRRTGISCIICLNEFCGLPACTCYVFICPDIKPCTIILIPGSDSITIWIHGHLRRAGVSCIICLNEFCGLPACPCYVSICPDVKPCTIILIPGSDSITIWIHGHLRRAGVSCIICLNEFCGLPACPCYVSICPDVKPCAVIMIPDNNSIAIWIHSQLRRKGTSCIICLNEFRSLPACPCYVSICPDVIPCAIILLPGSNSITI